VRPQPTQTGHDRLGLFNYLVGAGEQWLRHDQATGVSRSSKTLAGIPTDPVPRQQRPRAQPIGRGEAMRGDGPLGGRDT
jgi:hypothetical protein